MVTVKSHTRKTKKGQSRVRAHARKHVPFPKERSMIESAVFKHKDTGELRTRIPLMDINDWERVDERPTVESRIKESISYDAVDGEASILLEKLPLKTKSDLISNLSQFHGTEQYFYNPLFKNIKYTDGVKYLSDKLAGWLVTDILAVAGSKLKNEEFIVWELVVDDNEAHLTARTDKGEPAKYTQHYLHTDLPDGTIKLYQQNGVLMLPSEY